MIGNAGKKIQNIVDLAEELYEKVNQLRDQIAALSETLDDTHDRVAGNEAELAEQRALLEAIAEENDIDVEETVAEAAAAVEEEPTEGESSDESTEDSTETAAPDQG